MEILGTAHWMIWIIGVLVFGLAIVLLARAALRERRRPPEQPSAAAALARRQQLPQGLQDALAELNQRKDDGKLSELDYEQARSRLLAEHAAPR
jgi:flagellar biosynthesis/type III secretory pathway M-ring protein FliF/YscJ